MGTEGVLYRPGSDWRWGRRENGADNETIFNTRILLVNVEFGSCAYNLCDYFRRFLGYSDLLDWGGLTRISGRVIVVLTERVKKEKDHD